MASRDSPTGRWEEWAARGGLTARGRCIEFNDPIPYQPVLDAIGSVADITGIISFATLDSGGLPSVFPEASAVRSASMKSDVPWPAAKLRLFRWLLARLEKASRRRPLMVVIEDLQWADTSSMDFLAYLIERARNMRLLVLVTARPLASTIDHDGGIKRISRYCTTMIRVGSLTPVETAELVQVLLESPRIAPHLAKLIYRETEGNPLFIVETIRLLQQKGRPFGDKASLHTADSPVWPATSIGIPDGVRSAVEQRLQLIDSAPLRIAQVASVLGRSFDEEMLSMVAGMGANRLSRAVDLLLRAGIFERENAGYRFAHDKIRAVCYERVSGRLRRNYHARAAAILAEMPDVPIQRLAWHQFSASQWSLAASSWERAGDHAKAVHAYEEAFRAYQYAMKCVELETCTVAEAADLKRIRLSFKSDEVLAVLGRPTDRRTILERVGALCHRAGNSSLLMTLFIRKALLENHVGNFSAGVILARRAWSIARSEDDRPGEVDALLVLALMLFRAERYQRSLAVSRLTLTKLGDGRSPFKVTALLNAAAVYVMLGDHLPASTSLEEARRISIELGLRAEQCQVMTRRALLDKLAGRVQRSRMGFLEALELANETQDLVSATRIISQLATLDALEGRLGDAIRRLRQAIVASRNIGYFWTEVSCLNEVGYGVGRLLGNFRWARDASVHALRLPGTFNSRYLSWMLRDSRALLLLEEARYDEALTEIQEVLELIKPLHVPTASLESLARRGVIWLKLGDPAQAVADLESAREGDVRKGQRLMLPETLTYLAMAYGALGDANGAIASSHEAMQLLVEMNYANHQPQRVFWHHYLILEKFNREPRLHYLKRAVEFIEAQAATVSKAQAKRLRRDVRLNREILEAWERHKQNLQPTADERAVTPTAHEPASVAPASALPTM